MARARHVKADLAKIFGSSVESNFLARAGALATTYFAAAEAET
jgi:hypothetical protein